jgi:hypothetical protein
MKILKNDLIPIGDFEIMHFVFKIIQKKILKIKKKVH